MTARLILSLIMGVGLIGSATLSGAQGGPPPGGGRQGGGRMSPEMRAKMDAMRKATHLAVLKKLHLSSSQMHKIKDFDEHQERQRAQMMKGGRPDRDAMKKMRDDRDHVYQKVMSASQYKKYQDENKKAMDAMRAKMGMGGGRRGPGGPGGPGRM